MSRPIEAISDAQINAEIKNYERFRTSSDPAKRALFEKRAERYDELLAARATRAGFSFEASLRVIEAAARERRFVSYKDLADASGVNWTRAYRLVGGHLWDLVSWARRRGLPMLSAIVVNKENLATRRMAEETLAGFTRAAEALDGKQVRDPEARLREEQEAVFRHFSAPGVV